jgi:HK97 family phage major capsid protein
MNGQETVAEIRAIVENFRGKIPNVVQLGDDAIAQGTSIETFRTCLLAHMPGYKPVSQPSINLSGIPLERYSIARAILSASENKSGKPEGFEAEVSREMAKQSRRDPEGFYVPNQVLLSRADNLVGVNTMGGFLKATELLSGEFIEILRNQAKVIGMGARVLPGLVGDIVIPRQDGAATAYWTTETEGATQSNTNFGQCTLAPKCVTAFEVYSKKLLVQSTPAIDGLIRDDLAAVLGLAIDLAALHGTGANAQPTGIANTTGVATVACGTNGAIPTWANIVGLESQVSAGNADGSSMGYLTNALVRGALKTQTKNTLAGSAFIWEPNPAKLGTGMMNGYRAEVSNQVKSNLTKGTTTTVCSAIFYADWSQLFIGQWGGMDLVIDPYTLAANREVRVFAHNFLDINTRHAAAFALIADALTS